MAKWKSVRINFNDESEYKLYRAIETYLVMRGENIKDVFFGVMQGYTSEIGFAGLEKLVECVVSSSELIEAAESEGIRFYPKLLEVIREREFELGVDYWFAEGGERRVYRYRLASCLEKIVARYKEKRE